MQRRKQQISDGGPGLDTGIQGAQQGRTLVINKDVYWIAKGKATGIGLTLAEMVEYLLSKWIFNLLREVED